MCLGGFVESSHCGLRPSWVITCSRLVENAVRSTQASVSRGERDLGEFILDVDCRYARGMICVNERRALRLSDIKRQMCG